MRPVILHKEEATYSFYTGSFGSFNLFSNSQAKPYHRTQHYRYYQQHQVSRQKKMHASRCPKREPQRDTPLRLRKERERVRLNQQTAVLLLPQRLDVIEVIRQQVEAEAEQRRDGARLSGPAPLSPGCPLHLENETTNGGPQTGRAGHYGK